MPPNAVWKSSRPTQDGGPNRGNGDADKRDVWQQAPLVRDERIHQEDDRGCDEDGELRADDINGVHEPTLVMMVSTAGPIMSIISAG